MALPSKQISATSTLDEFLSWCESAGYRVGENPRFGSKTVTKGVHRSDSFHYVGEWSNLGRGLIRSSGVNTVGVKYSARIAQVQATLNKNYPAYSKLLVDGIDGTATQKAVREFQRRSGIKVDGIAGPITLGKLGLR